MSNPDDGPAPSADGEPSGPQGSGERHRSFLREVPALVLIAFAIAIVIKTFLVQAFFIPSESMERTLMPGDRVLVDKLSYVVGDIHRLNVVVFSTPTRRPPRTGARYSGSCTGWARGSASHSRRTRT